MKLGKRNEAISYTIESTTGIYKLEAWPSETKGSIRTRFSTSDNVLQLSAMFDKTELMRLARALGLEAEEDKRGLIAERVRLKRELIEAEEKLAASNQTLGHVVRERDELRRELGYTEMGADEWRARAESAEAKLARVEGFIASKLDLHHQGVVVAARVVESIRAALADPEPFVLPTTPGARFEARYGGRDAVDEFLTVSYGGGSAVAYVRLSTAKVYSKSQIMDQFAGHRVLDGDA